MKGFKDDFDPDAEEEQRIARIKTHNTDFRANKNPQKAHPQPVRKADPELPGKQNPGKLV